MPLQNLSGNTLGHQQQQQQQFVATKQNIATTKVEASTQLSTPIISSPTTNIPQNQQPHIVIVSVEAAIGTGKSSLLRMLKKRIGEMKLQKQDDKKLGSNWKWIFVQEPVEMWQDVRRFHSDKDEAEAEANNNDGADTKTTATQQEDTTVPSQDEFNLLGKFYNNPPEYAFKLQSWAVLSRIETVARTVDQIKKEFTEENDTRPVLLVLERSWTSDRNIFALNHRDTGLMKPYEWVMYDQLFSFANRNSPVIDGHIYLDCDVDTCMKRLKKRDRSEESSVSADYQQGLIKRHEDWLKNVPQDQLLRVDVKEEFIGNPERADAVFKQLCDFASSLFEKTAPVVPSNSASFGPQ
jgi:deoxyadenosine/deoxycytidine kinase